MKSLKELEKDIRDNYIADLNYLRKNSACITQAEAFVKVLRENNLDIEEDLSFICRGFYLSINIKKLEEDLGQLEAILQQVMSEEDFKNLGGYESCYSIDDYDFKRRGPIGQITLTIYLNSNTLSKCRVEKETHHCKWDYTEQKLTCS